MSSLKRPHVRTDYESPEMARYLNEYLMDVERETNSLITSKQARTYSINRLSDLPAKNASDEIQLDGTSHYLIRSDIDLGDAVLVAYTGTKISGEIAQRDILRSTNANGVIYCDGGGSFTTFIVSGPLRIINTAGHGIQYLDSAFLINQGCFMSVSNSHSGIVSIDGAALSCVQPTIFGSAIGIDIRNSMTFGSIITDFNSTMLAGIGIQIGDNTSASNVGVVIINGLNYTAALDGLVINGKSTSTVINSSRIISTGGTAFEINNTSGNKIDNLFISNPNFSGRGGHGLDISGGYIDTMNVDNGLIESQHSSSYAIKGVSSSSNVSGAVAFDSVTIRNTATAANTLTGISIKDIRVRFSKCRGVADTKQQGACGLTTLGSTQGSVSTTFVKVNPSGGSTAGELSKFTHTSPYRLTYNGIDPYVGRVAFDASIAQGSGTTKRIDVAIYKNGSQLTPTNQTVQGADSQNNRSAAFSITADVTLATNDYVELYVKIETGTETLEYDVLNFRCEDSL